MKLTLSEQNHDSTLEVNTTSGSTEPGNQISGDAKYYAATAKNDYTWRTRTTSETPGIKSTGESGVGKNMPPYLAVYVWKRIA